MERSSLFTRNRAGQAVRSNLHHVPWPLEEAEAEIERNDLAQSIGIELPDIQPVLHYSRRLRSISGRRAGAPGAGGRPVGSCNAGLKSWRQAASFQRFTICQLTKLVPL
jgi:hypothetical protein